MVFKNFRDGFIYAGLWLVCFRWVCFRYFETFELLCCKKVLWFFTHVLCCLQWESRNWMFPRPPCVFWGCFQLKCMEICIRKYAYVQVRCLARFISFIKLVLKLKEHVQLKLTVWVLSKYFPNMRTFAMLMILIMTLI